MYEYTLGGRTDLTLLEFEMLFLIIVDETSIFSKGTSITSAFLGNLYPLRTKTANVVSFVNKL